MRISLLKHSDAEWPNLTPMIDVIFLLIIFFILTGVYATAGRGGVTPPHLADADQLGELKRTGRLVIGIAAYSGEAIAAEADLAGQAAAWTVAGRRITPGNVSALAAEIRKARTADPDIDIQVRADRTVLYTQVAPVIATMAEMGIETVGYVASPQPDADGERQP